MNVGGIFAILDDVAATLDDVAVMSKVAAKKTAGLLGDDLAVNAQLSSNFASDRELPVLWAIAKGSFINKLIILPFAFLLSAFAPWAIAPILILGAAYLSYEGAEKIEEYLHKIGKPKEVVHSSEHDLNDETEKQKIKKAITTDFVLSIEIIVLTLGTVTDQPILTQIGVTSIIAILAVVVVYGLVALLVRMDDIGVGIMKKGEKKNSQSMVNFGIFLIESMPKTIKALSVIGVIAMLLVGGGIFNHNLPFLHDYTFLHNILGDFVIGLIAGFIIIGLFKIGNIFKRA